MNGHEPGNRLNGLMRRYPNTGRWVEQFLSDRGSEVPDWPKWCFLPVAGWYSIVSAHHGGGALSPALAKDVAKLAALGTWRYTQGIYRIDPDVMAALVDSAPTGDLPAEVLLRLPEWCVYVETPGWQWLEESLYGFWAHLEADANDGHWELRLLMNSETGLDAVVVYLGEWSLEEAISRYVKESERQARRAGVAMPLTTHVADILAQQIMPVMSVLLYLCSDEPEIDDAREPGTAPSRPKLKKTRKGLKLFPAKRVRHWAVGRQTGEQLRAAERESDEPGLVTTRPVRSHLRRGHWHGYWLGPRRGQRRFSYRWIAPLVVRGSQSPAADE